MKSSECNSIIFYSTEMFVESGLYEYIFKISLNPKRVGPDHGEKIVYRDIDFIDMNIEQLYGLFILLIFFEVISIVIYTIEIFHH